MLTMFFTQHQRVNGSWHMDGHVPVPAENFPKSHHYALIGAGTDNSEISTEEMERYNRAATQVEIIEVVRIPLLPALEVVVSGELKKRFTLNSDNRPRAEINAAEEAVTQAKLLAHRLPYTEPQNVISDDMLAVLARNLHRTPA